MRGLFPLGPISDGVGLNVTVVSSEDCVGFGIVTCPDVLADIDSLAPRIRVAFGDLAGALGLHLETSASARAQETAAS